MPLTALTLTQRLDGAGDRIRPFCDRFIFWVVLLDCPLRVTRVDHGLQGNDCSYFVRRCRNTVPRSNDFVAKIIGLGETDGIALTVASAFSNRWLCSQIRLALSGRAAKRKRGRRGHQKCQVPKADTQIAPRIS